MKWIDFSLREQTYHLALTAQALFTIYDRYGYTADIVGDLHLQDADLQGFNNTLWLFALLAQQGELQRRHLGYPPEPLCSVDALRILTEPLDYPAMLTAITEAIRAGFIRAVPESEEEDLVLAELDAAQKKKKTGAGSALRTLWRQLLSD